MWGKSDDLGVVRIYLDWWFSRIGLWTNKAVRCGWYGSVNEKSWVIRTLQTCCAKEKNNQRADLLARRVENVSLALRFDCRVIWNEIACGDRDNQEIMARCDTRSGQNEKKFSRVFWASEEANFEGVGWVIWQHREGFYYVALKTSSEKKRLRRKKLKNSNGWSVGGRRWRGKRDKLCSWGSISVLCSSASGLHICFPMQFVIF